MSDKDGGSAFPVDAALLRPPVSLGDDIEQRRAAKGMTLRDYFAAQVAVAVIRQCGSIECLPGETLDAMFARKSYAVADAMIEARKR